MIVLAISLYLISVFVATIIFMVIDGNTDEWEEPIACFACGLVWPAVMVIALTIYLINRLQKVANWIIQRRSDKGI